MRKLISSEGCIEAGSFHPIKKHHRGMPQQKSQVYFDTHRRFTEKDLRSQSIPTVLLFTQQFKFKNPIICH